MPHTNQDPPPWEFDLHRLVIRLDLVIQSDITVMDDTVARILRLLEKSYGGDEIEDI